ncbi:MAG TPA: hypothetical protein VJN29_10260 [Intrasporangium sp.]|uniref:hypothetical protein n=1 Tax=Intrasporangium sp. TaxID=1925024 RepID=UPI002B486930|nr:hypothetical protein [Intrasporangium sp.]HKX67596.1 hypothetical protein [Intrasporangium sp.]
MSTLYPSRDTPGPPSVAVDVPEGTALAAKLPREGGYHPVVVSIEQCGAELTEEEALRRIDALAESRGGVTSESYAAQLGHARFVGCDATWPDADVETILQANLFHFVRPEREAAAWVVQLSGSVGGPSAEQDHELIRSVLASVRVRPWAAALVEAEGNPVA